MSEGLVEDEFTNRPEDDELAFLHYEKLFRAPLDKSILDLKEREGDAYWDSYHHFMQTYINSVLAMVIALDLPLLEFWINNQERANNVNNFKQIKFDIE